MSDCKFCGKPAGFFHNKHHECAENHENGRRQITHLIFGEPLINGFYREYSRPVIRFAEQSILG